MLSLIVGFLAQMDSTVDFEPETWIVTVVLPLPAELPLYMPEVV